MLTLDSKRLERTGKYTYKMRNLVNGSGYFDMTVINPECGEPRVV